MTSGIEENLSDLERRALRSAELKFAKLFSKPDSLVNIDSIKHRVNSERDVNDSNLKNSIQSQLESIKLAVDKLNTASTSCKEVIDVSNVLVDNLHQMQVIAKKVQSLKDNSKIHQQLKSIIENFQPIFEFNSLISEAFSHLNKQRPDILQAHCIYLKLETARNICMLEIYKSLSDSSNQNSGNIIYNYFKNIIALYAKIENKLLHITQNIFEKIVEDPAMIVNCLRIIEREEKLDHYAQVQFEKFKFTTPNRPKQLKERFCQYIDSNINSTLQEIMNSDDKLQVKAKVMLDMMYKHLRIAKYIMRDCFPPSYQILNHVYEIYHEKISGFFSREAIGAKEEDVVVILLTNIDYLSNKYLRNDDLKLKGIELKPLLSEQLVTKLSSRYSFDTTSKFAKWINNALNEDVKEWKTEDAPLLNADNIYETRLDNTLVSIVDAILKEIASVLSTQKSYFIIRAIETINSFIPTYLQTITSYFTMAIPADSDRIIEKRKRFSFLIANMNNGVLMFKDFDEIFSTYIDSGSNEVYTQLMENMYKSIKMMNIRLTQTYAESLNVTLIPLFKLLFTQEWAGEKNFVDKVFSLVDDDASEMRYLETTNLSIMLENLYIHIISCYYARFFSLKDKIKSRDMRYSYSNKAISEMDAITESADLEGDAKNYITFIGKSFKCFMNILQINDINMLYIELQDSEKYLCVFPPDFIEHALNIKGDLSNNEVKECVRVLRYDKSDEKINAFVNLIKKNM